MGTGKRAPLSLHPRRGRDERGEHRARFRVRAGGEPKADALDAEPRAPTRGDALLALHPRGAPAVRREREHRALQVARPLLEALVGERGVVVEGLRHERVDDVLEALDHRRDGARARRSDRVPVRVQAPDDTAHRARRDRRVRGRLAHNPPTVRAQVLVEGEDVVPNERHPRRPEAHVRVPHAVEADRTTLVDLRAHAEPPLDPARGVHSEEHRECDRLPHPARHRHA